MKIENESEGFIKNLIPQKKIEETKISSISGAETEKKPTKKSTYIIDEIIAEAKNDESRKVALMGHVEPEIYDKILEISKKTGRTKSKTVNEILKKALGLW